MEFLQEVLQAIILVIVPILGGFLTNLAHNAGREAKARTESELAQRYITEIEGSISAAVAAVSQTYVDELKNSDAFNTTNQQTALNKAFILAQQMLSADAGRYLKQVYSDVGTYLIPKIEEAVRGQKLTDSVTDIEIIKN